MLVHQVFETRKKISVQLNSLPMAGGCGGQKSGEVYLTKSMILEEPVHPGGAGSGRGLKDIY